MIWPLSCESDNGRKVDEGRHYTNRLEFLSVAPCLCENTKIRLAEDRIPHGATESQRWVRTRLVL